MVAAYSPDLSSRLHLDAAIEQTLAQARKANFRAYLRVHRELSSTSFLDYLDLVTQENDQVMAWSDGRENRSFAAIGEEVGFPVHSVIRFAQAGSGCLELCEQVVQVSLDVHQAVTPGVPVAVGGFSFAPRERESCDMWQGWEDGHLWVPTLLLHRQGSTRGGVVTCVVSPGDRPEAIRERLHVGLAKLARLEEQALLGAETKKQSKAVTPLRQVPKTNTRDRQAWCHKVAAAKAAILEGQFDKVVLARAEHLSAPHGTVFSPVHTLQALRERYPDCKVFMIRKSDGSSFVGATPELFLRLDGEKVETVSLAGTARRGTTTQCDSQLGDALLKSVKDRHEHQVVTEAICAALTPLSNSLNVAPSPRLLRLSNVQHLETRIHGELDRPRTVMELLARMHPTPAVGGAPTLEALSWIKRHEELDRGWYAGLVGWLTVEGEALFAVAIRSAMLRENQAWAFAGAGLVADSDPESEWDETAMKLLAIRQNLMLRTRSGA